MELTRRQFGRRLLVAAAGCLAGAWRVAGSPVVARVTRAIGGAVFPGRVVPIDPAQVARTGKWLG